MIISPQLFVAFSMAAILAACSEVCDCDKGIVDLGAHVVGHKPFYDLFLSGLVQVVNVFLGVWGTFTGRNSSKITSCFIADWN